MRKIIFAFFFSLFIFTNIGNVQAQPYMLNPDIKMPTYYLNVATPSPMLIVMPQTDIDQQIKKQQEDLFKNIQRLKDPKCKLLPPQEKKGLILRLENIHLKMGDVLSGRKEMSFNQKQQLVKFSTNLNQFLFGLNMNISITQQQLDQLIHHVGSLEKVLEIRYTTPVLNTIKVACKITYHSEGNIVNGSELHLNLTDGVHYIIIEDACNNYYKYTITVHCGWIWCWAEAELSNVSCNNCTSHNSRSSFIPYFD